MLTDVAGAALILLTWAGWLAAMIGIGWVALRSFSRHVSLRTVLQGALWTGLATALILAAGLNLLVPNGSGLVAAVAATFLVCGWVALGLGLFRHRSEVARAAHRVVTFRRIPTLLYVGLVVVSLGIIANFATAEPMDADTGGYRLGLINYAREYAVIPGLANLHDRFGFNSSLYPLAPFIEHGMWQAQGFRLVAGLLVAALAIDLLLRVLVPRRNGATPGDWYLVVATAFLMAIILTDSGRWIASPAQDIAGYVPAAAAMAFLADSLWRSNDRALALNLAILTASVSGSLRPLGWLLAALVTVIAVAVLMRDAAGGGRRALRALRTLLPSLAVSALIAVIMLARDALLTGWLLFPAKILPLPVAWRVPDPSGTAQAITAWGRAPGRPADEVLASSDWLAPWVSMFLHSREVYLLGLIVVFGVLPTVLWRHGRGAWRRVWRPLIVVLIPAVVYSAAWFITAPDVRFGWAGLATLAAMPFAWLAAAGAYPAIGLRVIGLVILVGMLATQVANNRVMPRGAEPVPTTLMLGPISVTVPLAGVRIVDAVDGQLPDGTPILYPATGVDCWNLFPLCVMGGFDPQAVRLGAGIQDGFAATRP